MTRSTHSYRRRIAFAEADPAGVVHFTSLLQIVEEAEHDWMRANGVEIITPRTGWPRVNLKADFRSPAMFGDDVLVELSITETGRTSVTWAFTILMPDDRRIVAEGSMATCFVTRGEADGKWTPTELPTGFRA